MNKIQKKLIKFINLPQISWHNYPNYIWCQYSEDYCIDIFENGFIRRMEIRSTGCEREIRLMPEEAKRILEKAFKLKNFQ